MSAPASPTMTDAVVQPLPFMDLPAGARLAAVQHMTGDTRVELSRTGRSAQHWLLQDAHRLSVTLHFTDTPVEERLKVLQGVHHALTVRDGRLATLKLHLGTDSEQPISQIIEALQPVGSGVTELFIFAPAAAAAALEALGKALPALTSLHLYSSCSESVVSPVIRFSLPDDPSCFPALRSIHFDDAVPVDEPVGGLQRYMSQLTALRNLWELGIDAECFLAHSLVVAASPWPLQQLELSQSLDDTLAALLMQHAPALVDLTAPSTRLTHRAQQRWGLRRLGISGQRPNAIQLFYLPLAQEGVKTAVHLPRSKRKLWIWSEGEPQWTSEDLGHLALPALTQLEVECDKMQSRHVARLLAASVPALKALAQVMPNLHLHLSLVPFGRGIIRSLGEIVEVYPRVAMSVRVESQYADHPQPATEFDVPLPPLEELDMTQTVWSHLGTQPVVDLAWLLRNTSAVKTVKALVKSLTDHGCATQPWPWRRLELGLGSPGRGQPVVIKMYDLLGLPDPSRCDRPAQLSVHKGTLCLDKSVTPMALARLQHLRLEVSGIEVSASTLSASTLPAQQAADLRTKLQLLRAMGVTGFTHFSLQGWTLSAEVVAELGGLPECDVTPTEDTVGTLEFSFSAWVADKEVYRALADVIPASYKVWKVGSQCPNAVQDLLQHGLSARDVVVQR